MKERCFTLKKYLEKQFEKLDATFACRCESPAEFEQWKSVYTKELQKAIGPAPGHVNMDAETVMTLEVDEGYAEKVVFNSAVDLSVVAWMLLPKTINNGKKHPAVLLIPGHTGDNLPGAGRIVDETSGKAWATGLNPDGSACDTRYHNNISQELLKAGFIVFCPDMLGFGERASDTTWARNKWTHLCNLYAVALGFFGEATLTGIYLNDLKCSLDYLNTRTEVDASRIGAAGCSLGAMWIGFLAALDDRIQASVLSNCYPNYKAVYTGKKLAICGSQTLTGQAQLGDGGDVICALAPRPVQVQIANQDPGMTVEQTTESVAKAERIYRLLGKDDFFEYDYFQGEHELDPSPAVRWFKKWLGKSD